MVSLYQNFKFISCLILSLLPNMFNNIEKKSDPKNVDIASTYVNFHFLLLIRASNTNYFLIKFWYHIDYSILNKILKFYWNWMKTSSLNPTRIHIHLKLLFHKKMQNGSSFTVSYRKSYVYIFLYFCRYLSHDLNNTLTKFHAVCIWLNG